MKSCWKNSVKNSGKIVEILVKICRKNSEKNCWKTGKNKLWKNWKKLGNNCAKNYEKNILKIVEIICAKYCVKKNV